MPIYQYGNSFYYACSGITKKGEQCKNGATTQYGGLYYCQVHHPMNISQKQLTKSIFDNLPRTIFG